MESIQDEYERLLYLSDHDRNTELAFAPPNTIKEVCSIITSDSSSTSCKLFSLSYLTLSALSISSLPFLKRILPPPLSLLTSTLSSAPLFLQTLRLLCALPPLNPSTPLFSLLARAHYLHYPSLTFDILNLIDHLSTGGSAT